MRSDNHTVLATEFQTKESKFFLKLCIEKIYNNDWKALSLAVCRARDKL
jgi:hypothetical protein